MRFTIDVHEEGVTIHLDHRSLDVPSMAIPYVLSALAQAHVRHLDQDRLAVPPESLN